MGQTWESLRLHRRPCDLILFRWCYREQNHNLSRVERNLSRGDVVHRTGTMSSKDKRWQVLGRTFILLVLHWLQPFLDFVWDLLRPASGIADLH